MVNKVMNEKPKLLISECLCGSSCRYDGKDNLIKQLPLLQDTFDLVPVCPEVLGGLSTPRDPAERQGERICTANGIDVTKEFLTGAQNTLELAFQNGCNQALMKAKSPSCGYKRIYDGTFSKTLRDGHGCTVEVLLKNNIKVYTEDEIDLLIEQKRDEF